MSGRRRAVHIHIPKCGGTTVTRYLRKIVGSSRVAHYGRREQTAEFRRAAPDDLARYWVIGGHIPYETLHAKIGDGPLYFAIVREPFDLFVSFYQDVSQRVSHPLHNEAKGMRPLEFLEFSVSNNSLRRQLYYFDRECSFDQAVALVTSGKIKAEILPRMNRLLSEIAAYFERAPMDLPHSNKSNPIELEDEGEIRALVERHYSDDRRFFEFVSSRSAITD